MLQAAVEVPAQSATDAFRVAVGNALGMFVRAVPRVLGFAAVLLVGWLVAALVGRAVLELLRIMRFDHLAERSGLAGFVRGMGASTGASAFVADLARWFIRLTALVVAFDSLGLPAVSGVLQRLLLWLPNVVAALVALVVGGLAAKALGRLVRGSAAEAGFGNPELLANVARVTVMSLAVVVAIDQIGIARTVIDTLLVGVVGALALASGLAFGLGGRDKAAQLLDTLGRHFGPTEPRARVAAARPRGERRFGSESRAPADVAAEERGSAGRATFVERAGQDRRRVVLDALESGRGPEWIVRSSRDRRTT